MKNPTIMLSLESAGDLSPDLHDNIPNQVYSVVRYSKTVPIIKGVSPEITLGASAPISVSEQDEYEKYFDTDTEEPEDYGTTVEVEFPDYNTEYGDNNTKVVPENQLDVPEELLVKINDSISDSKDIVRDCIVTLTGALIGHEEGSIYMETALRDGLDIDISVDQGVQEAFVPLSRLVILSNIISKLPLPETVSSILLTKLAEDFGTDIVTSTKKKTNDTMQQLQKLYAANITKAGLENDVPENHIGTRTSRR